MNNPVRKYDFNKGGWHRDEKNDYDRSTLKRDLERELEEETLLDEDEDDNF